VNSKTKKLKRDDVEQSKLFLKKAREIGADEECSRADELIGQLAKKATRTSAQGLGVIVAIGR
jgi:hypothetical protein